MNGSKALRFALADLMVEDILSMSDEEVCAELVAEGLDPEAEADRIRRVADRAITIANSISVNGSPLGPDGA